MRLNVKKRPVLVLDKVNEHYIRSIRCIGALLSNAWGTGLLADPDMFGFMVMVRLPDGVLPLDKSDNQNAEKLSFTDDHAAKLQDILHYDFKVEVCSAYCVDTQQL